MLLGDVSMLECADARCVNASPLSLLRIRQQATTPDMYMENIRKRPLRRKAVAEHLSSVSLTVTSRDITIYTERRRRLLT